MADTEAAAVQVNGDGRGGGWAAVLDRLRVIGEMLGAPLPDGEPGWLAGFRADLARLEALAVGQAEYDRLRRECDCYLEAIYATRANDPVPVPTLAELRASAERVDFNL